MAAPVQMSEDVYDSTDNVEQSSTEAAFGPGSQFPGQEMLRKIGQAPGDTGLVQELKGKMSLIPRDSVSLTFYFNFILNFLLE